MDIRTQPPPQTASRSVPQPRANRSGRALLTAFVVALVLTTAVVVSVLYGTRPQTTQASRPGVSPVQVERWDAADPATDFDHEHQSLRTMVRPADDDAGAGKFNHEHQSLRSAVDRDR